MTRDQFVEALKKYTAATEQEWYLYGNRLMRIQVGAPHCPLTFVCTMERDEEPSVNIAFFKEAGYRLGLSKRDTDAIMCAADGLSPDADLRAALLEAAGVGAERMNGGER